MAVMGKFERKTRVCYFEGRNLVLYVPDTNRGQELLFQAYQSEWGRIISTLANLKGDDIVDQLGRKLKDIPRIKEFISQLQPFCVYDLSGQQMLIAHDITEISLENGETWFYTDEGQEIGVYRQGYQWARRSWQWLIKLDWKEIGQLIGIFICCMLIFGIAWLDERWQKAKADAPDVILPDLRVEDRLQTDGYLVIQSDSTFSKITYSIGQEGLEQTIATGDTLFPRISGKIKLKGWRDSSFNVKEYTFDQSAWVQYVLKNEVGSRQFKALFLQKPLRIVYDGLFEDEVNDSEGLGKIQLMIQRLDSYRVERVVLYPERQTGYPCVKEIYLQSNS